MKALIIITFLIFISISHVYSQAEIPVVYKEYVKINENPDKIKESKIRVKTDITTENEIADTSRILIYDDAGRLIKEYKNALDTYHKRIRYNYTYVYGKKGLLSQKIDSTYSEVVKINLEYDDLALISKETEINSRGQTLREVDYEYDDLSRLIEANELNLINNCSNNLTYQYDSYNNLAKLTMKRSCPGAKSEVLVYKYTYLYDNKYNIIEKVTKFPSGQVKNEKFKYDANGNVVQSIENISNDEHNEYVYYYDKSNNKIKTEKKEVNGLFFKSYIELYNYNEKGALSDVKVLGPEEEVISAKKYIYEYY